MRKLYFFLLIFSFHSFAKSLTLQNVQTLARDYGILMNTNINLALKTPLIMHNSISKETHILFIFEKDQTFSSLRDLTLVKQDDSYAYYLFSKNSTKSNIKTIVKNILITEKTVLNFSLFPKAYAETSCPSNFAAQNLTPEINKTAAYFENGSYTEQILSCLSGIAEGAWDSTVGAINSFVSFVTEPLETIKETYESATEVLELIKNLGQTFKQFKDTFKSLDNDAKVSIICSFLGSIGVDALLGFLVPNGAVKLVGSFSSFLTRFAKMGKMIALAKNQFNNLIPKDFLTKLAKGEIQDKVIERIDKFAEHNMGDLASCVIQQAL